MPPDDSSLRKWWPTTQSLDLVQGDLIEVSSAIRSEVERYALGTDFFGEWQNFNSFDQAMESVEYFSNYPTIYLIIPTVSKWIAVWNNSFLCDGHASLCHNLVQRHGLTTMHWSAHDALTTFQPGATFTYATPDGSEIRTRSVYVGKDCNRWEFHQEGVPLQEEDPAGYLKKRKRDRLNEAVMISLLARLGARPWQDDFYAFGRTATYVLRRTVLPEAICSSVRSPDLVVKALRSESGSTHAGSV